MTPNQTTVLAILAQHAQRTPESLQSSDALIDLDIDSLKFIMMVLEVEQALNQSVFDIENVGQLRTVGDILNLVATPPAKS